MAPSATKRKSSETDFSVPQNEPPQTPAEEPPKKKLRITRNQKQALIENLHLEITERARKLRAQYDLQASDLRARIERRVNRIPVGLRKATMGELLEKHNSAALRAQHVALKKPVSPSKSRNVTAISTDHTMRNSPARKAKKQSHENLYSDKENAPSARNPGDVLNNPKKRVNPGAVSGPPRVVSGDIKGPDYRILSPKSLNSRAYPHSPFRASPGKSRVPSYLSHQASPLKASSPLKAANARSTQAPTSATRQSSQAKRSTHRTASKTTAPSNSLRSPLAARASTHQHDRKESTGTVSSSASSGTIVKPMRPTTVMGKSTPTSSNAAAKKTVTRNQAPSAAAKRTAASASRNPTTTDAPASGRRTLRKRV